MVAAETNRRIANPSLQKPVRNQRRITPPLATIAIISLAICLLYWAQAVLIPTALAILLTFLLGPLVAWVQKRGVPRVPAVLLVVTVAGVLLSLLGWLFVSQSLQLVNELPKYQAKVAERIEQIRSGQQQSLLTKVQSFSDRVIEAITKPNGKAASSQVQPPQPVRIVDDYRTWITPFLQALTPLLSPIAAAGLVLILLIYALIERESMRDRLLRLIGRGHIPLTTVALDDAGQRISRYLLAQLMINITFGVVIGLGLWLIGVPHALLWGIFATFLRYVPIVGPWLSAILPLAISLFTATGWTQPILVVLLFVVFELVANLIVEPWLYGHTMGVSQCALLIAIAFWTWLWGPMGLVLAAPLTVCLMILGRYVPALKFFDILLGNEQPLTADVRFYQRLLAHNQDEASQIAQEQFREHSLQQVYDEVIVPALTHAREDVESGRLAESDAQLVWEMSDEIAEELGLLSDSAKKAVDEPPLAEYEIAQPRIRILACPARDEADQVALSMFQRMLDPKICDMETATTDRLTSEIVSQVEEDHPSIVCIAALPPGGIAHTRLLCKRLRQRYPTLKIVVGRWGAHGDVASRDELTSAGADLVGTSMAETTGQLVQLVQFLRPVAASNNETVAESIEESATTNEAERLPTKVAAS